MAKIISLSITNSNFFVDNFKIDFSEKLNCVMGGRGTGKSTLLHFIKSCIDPDAEEQKNSYNVLKNNLGNGLITLWIKDDENRLYKIEKSFEEFPQAYTGKSESFIDILTILNKIQCDVYEAQSIEEIGRNHYDRLLLLDKMIADEKEEIMSDINDVQIELSDNCQLIRSTNARLSQLRNGLKNYEGVEDELLRLKEEKPDDIVASEEKQFEEADANEKTRSAEQRYLKSSQKKLDDVEINLKEIAESVEILKNFTSNTQKLGNTSIIEKAKKEYSSIVQQLEKIIKDGLQHFNQTKQNTTKLAGELANAHLIQQNEFTKLKQKFEKHKTFYNKWQSLTKKIDEKEAIAKDIDATKAKLAKIKKARKVLILKLNELKIELFNLRKQKVDELNTQFAGSIKITLALGGITDKYETLLKNGLRGSNMRYNILIPSIVQNFTSDRFAEIVHEKDAEALKVVAGIDKERAEAIFNALYESDIIYEIECLYCSDLPDFLLKIDAKNDSDIKGRENYKKSEELSTGQRCTTVLPIIFAVSQNPLIIDQPEDNLDNKYISESIHSIIRENKSARQLIFITHNPNIPVLSESERNFFLNYSDKKSSVETHGTVDEVKTEILNLLEGGEEAFMKRENLYSLNRM